MKDTKKNTVEAVIKWAHRLPHSLMEDRENGRTWEWALANTPTVALDLVVSAYIAKTNELVNCRAQRYGVFNPESGEVADYGLLPFMADRAPQLPHHIDDPQTWIKSSAAFRAMWDGKQAWDSAGHVVSPELLELIIPVKRDWRLLIPESVLSFDKDRDPVFTSVNIGGTLRENVRVRHIGFLDLDWVAEPLPFQGRNLRPARGVQLGG